jgi:hypothetical protein
MARYIKHFATGLLLSLVGLPCTAQLATKTSYFVENSTHRHLMNPALAPVRGYFSFPVAGEIYFGNVSNITFTNFIYPANEASEGMLRTFMHPSIDANEFLSKLKEDQYMNLDLRTSLFSFGYWSGNSFITFDLASRTNFSLNLPYDMFAFFKKGMTSAVGDTYHLDNLSVAFSTIAEASLGFSVELSDRLRVGVKGKILAGGAQVKAQLEQMEIAMTPDQWSITSVGSMEAYGKGISFVKDADNNVTNISIDQSALGLGGMGLALDLGFEYRILPGLKLSMAVVDFGRIKWNKANILKATSSGSVSFSGIDHYNPDSLGQLDMESQVNGIKDDLIAMSQLKQQSVVEDFIQKINPTINTGLEYSLKRISLGGLMSTRFIRDKRYTEYTASLNLKPIRMFNLSGSYSFIYGKQETFGFALGFVPGFFNLFVSCDYVPTKLNPQFIPLNTTNTNVQIGLSIPLGKQQEKELVEEEYEDDETSETEEDFIIVR